LKRVELRALSQAGNELTANELKSWYVLAGRERPYEVTLPAGVCAETQRLEVTVESEQGSFTGVADDAS
jgi:hypothetical protein